MLGGGFDQFDEHPTAVLGMDEVDAGIRRPTSWGVVDQTQTCLAKAVTGQIDVGDSEGNLLDALTVLIEVLGDRRFGGQWSQQLDTGVTEPDHRLVDTLILVDLLMNER